MSEFRMSGNQMEVNCSNTEPVQNLDNYCTIQLQFDPMAVSNSNKKSSFNTQIIQAYDQATLIVITVAVNSLVVGDK